MKKFIIGFIVCLLCSSAFSRLNVRANTFGGIGFIAKEDEPFLLLEFPVSADYEFSVSGLENDTFAVGVTGSLLLFPFSLLNFSYIHCLQPNSTKNYRWYIESELHTGFTFLGEYFLNEEAGISSNDVTYCSTFIVDFLFTFKPKSNGFYFGAGPVCSFMFVPYKTEPDTKWGWAITPSLELSVGYTFLN